MKSLEQLKAEIEDQKIENTKLYEVFQYRMYADEMQPFIERWRSGSRRLRELNAQLNNLLRKKSAHCILNERHTFVNGYGEATTREIASSTYSRASKKLSNQILKFIS